MSTSLRIAVEGCGHGTLDAIYTSVAHSCEIRGWPDVDLLIICGDFQAVRTQQDLNVTAMPEKYRQMGDFWAYYYGHKTAPYLTVFVGGNHEASNHLSELYYGGWVAPNIYYLGAANVIRFGPVKISAMSGIYEERDYNKNHHERLPYSSQGMRTIYRLREVDVRKLLAYRSQVDIGISHDWPRAIEWLGDHQTLFRIKNFLLQESLQDQLGSKGAIDVLDRLRPAHWFSAHMHFQFVAEKNHETYDPAIVEQGKDEHRPRPKSRPENPLANAWTNFSDNAKTEKLDKSKQQTAAPTLSDVSNVAEYNFEETHKSVKVNEINGLQIRENVEPRLSQLDGTCFSVPKRRRSPSEERSPQIQNVQSTVVNPDAIDISMSDSDDDSEDQLLSKPVGKNPEQKKDTLKATGATTLEDSTAVENTHSPQRDDSIDAGPADAFKAPEIDTQIQSKDQDTQDEISEELRAELAGLSTKFSLDDQIEKSPDLPHPVNITNKSTKFLALSKVERNHDRDFLALLEVEPLITPSQDIQRPLKLEYDPEWLAILRAFSDELILGGDARDKAPAHRGDTYYRDRIVEEEAWIEKNISKEQLIVPENFEITTDEAKVTGQNDHKMPREQTNAQTTQFCKLIGIENKFDFSEEDRDARIAAGPPQDGRGGTGGSQNYRGVRGGNRQSRGGRGRGRGRGRGGRW